MRWISTICGGAFGKHASGPGARPLCTFYSFELLPFNFPGAGAGGRVLSGPLQSAVLVCMAASREGKRAALCFLALLSFEFSRLGAGRRFSGGSLQSTAALSI